MNFQDKRLRILIIGVVIILGVVAFRVISNIMARNEQANKSNQGRTAVIMAAYPKRQTIVPKFRFSGTLDPIWQADVAAKVDGRIEQVLVQEGQAVEAGVLGGNRVLDALGLLLGLHGAVVHTLALGHLLFRRSHPEHVAHEDAKYQNQSDD